MIAQMAPAKINLVLEVGPLRSDGFHELATVFQAVALYDRVAVEEAGDGISLVVSGPRAGLDQVPDGPGNLVWRAAELLAAEAGVKAAGVRIYLEKHIPSGAGLGGGSSDAAAALRALASLWQISDQSLLQAVAARLGSDVPFFLQGGAALGRGRGECLAPLQLPPTWYVLAYPGVAASTAAVYRQLDALRSQGEAPATSPALGRRCQEFVQALVASGPAAAGPLLENDLALAAQAVSPAITSVLTAFLAAGALGANVSGSGSTVFALAKDAGHAEQLARQAANVAPWTWWGPSIPGME